jgi:hypothetical protein
MSTFQNLWEVKFCIGGSDHHDYITKNIYFFFKGSLNVAPVQCDQIKRKFGHLGYFLLNQFSLNQAVWAHGLL